MKTRFTLLLAFCAAFSVSAQSVVPQNFRATATMEAIADNGIGRNEILYGIPLEPGKVIGDSYMDTDWNVGSILLYKNDNVFEPLSLRYDIRTNEVDIQVGSDVKVIPGNRVKSFQWTDGGATARTYFLNAHDYKMNGVPFTGFFKVLSDGKLPLFAHTTIAIKKADYNVQLSMGSRDDKIMKKVNLFILKDGNIVEAPSSKKKLLPFFGDKAGQVSTYIKQQALVCNREEDMRKIFDYYNAL